MDKDVFVIYIEGTGNTGQRHRNIVTIGINGISCHMESVGHRKASNKSNKGEEGKRNWK